MCGALSLEDMRDSATPDGVHGDVDAWFALYEVGAEATAFTLLQEEGLRMLATFGTIFPAAHACEEEP